MLRIASILVLLGLLMDVRPTRSAEWSPLAPMPEGRFGAGAAVQGQRLLVLGGFSSSVTGTVVSWDGSSWSSVAPLTEPRLHAGAATLGTQVYACGGFDSNGNPIASVERSDGTASWSPVAPLPAALGGHAVVAIGDAIYVAGGQDSNMGMSGACFRYTPDSNSWSAMAAMPTPRAGVASAVVNGQLWVIGGVSPEAVSTVERYDPASNAWSSAPGLPEPLGYAASAVFDGRVWVLGGTDYALQRSPRVYSAGPDGVWQQETALPAALAGPTAGVAGNCLVLAGGIGDSGMPEGIAFSTCVSSPPPPPPPPPPVEPLTVALSISPTTLGGWSQGLWISARIVPDGWHPEHIVVQTLTLDDVAVDLAAPVEIDVTETGEPRLTVKFSRGPFTALPPGVHELVLRGQRDDGALFRGSASITVNSSGLNQRGALRVARAVDGRTSVIVSLQSPEEVRLDVIDLQGRVVERLLAGTLSAGDHISTWPRAGQGAARGSYFVRLQRPGATEAAKLQVTRLF